MKTTAWMLVLMSVLVAGCSRSGDNSSASNAPDGAAPSAPGFDTIPVPVGERTWEGLLPCSDCQGIDTRLVLRFDAGRREYLMTETYLGGTGKNSFDTSGTWSESTEIVDGELHTFYVLDPDRAGQRLLLQPDGALELLDGDDNPPAQAVEFRLQRQ